MYLRKLIKPKIYALILWLIVAAFLMTSCTASKSVNPVQAEIEETPAPEQKADYIISISEPFLFGCQRAVVGAEFLSLDDTLVFPEEIGFLLEEIDTGNISSVSSESHNDNIYYIFDSLSPNTAYSLAIWFIIDGEKTISEQKMEFHTPVRTLSFDNLEKYIYDELSEFEVTEENKLLLETQACMALLGMETGKYGIENPLFQFNLCRLEYSLNSRDKWVNYDGILGVPNETTLGMLKDVLSQDIIKTERDIIREFVPSPYFLSSYAVQDENGRSLDIESYILEQIYQNEEAHEFYKEYPFDITTSEFKEKYEHVINSDMTEEEIEKKLAGVSAKNKAQFSYRARNWMRETGKPLEPLVTIAGSDNQLTINTLVAYSFLYIDAYRETGRKYVTSTTYRTIDFQWELYSQKAGKSVAYRRNEDWHSKRQRLSFVPGFSNHQYGVAIDFYERTSFGDTELFQYIKENGAKYGFYNYLPEPWHWVYLGESFQE